MKTVTEKLKQHKAAIKTDENDKSSKKVKQKAVVVKQKSNPKRRRKSYSLLIDSQSGRKFDAKLKSGNERSWKGSTSRIAMLPSPDHDDVGSLRRSTRLMGRNNPIISAR